MGGVHLVSSTHYLLLTHYSFTYYWLTCLLTHSLTHSLLYCYHPLSIAYKPFSSLLSALPPPPRRPLSHSPTHPLSVLLVID